MEKIIQITSKPDTSMEFGGIYALTSEGRLFMRTVNSPWEEVSLPPLNSNGLES